MHSRWRWPSFPARRFKGELEVKLYNQNLDLGCRVKEISEWQYEDKTPKKEEEVQVF